VIGECSECSGEFLGAHVALAGFEACKVRLLHLRTPSQFAA
jgi:hypothetical protein